MDNPTKDNTPKNISKYIFREANLPEPTEKVSRTSGTVFWGEDNLQPQFLNRLYYENPVHGGIINQKVKFITAGGLSVEGGDASVLENAGSAFSIEDVYESTCRDFEIGETQAWYWKKNRATGLWYVEPMDYELIRVNENNVFYEYSDDWSKRQQNVNQGHRLIKNIHYILEEDTECLMLVTTRPKQRTFENIKLGLTANYYPAVNYSGAIVPILTAIEMDFFSYSEVVNGFKGGTLINLANGRPKNKEERNKIESELKINATDRNKQGGLVVTYSDGKDNAPTVEQINGNDLDKRYEQLEKRTTGKTMIAHGVISPALFGVFTESMFGSKEEMETAYLLFRENYVEVRQRQMLNPLNWALEKLNGFQGKIIAKDFTPAILQVKVEPVNIQAEKMSKQDDSLLVISEFMSVGIPRSECKVMHSKQYEDYTDNEDSFKAEYIKSKFAIDLTELQRTIITMIGDGESYSAIKTALDITGRELSNELVNLGRLGALDGWEVTDTGKEVVLPEQDFRVLYSYEKKPTAPDLVAGGKSRPFCETLIKLDRLYTRQEIETISANVDRNVWSYRGGWYHNPDTDRNTPSCRHTWVQNISL
jgi:hypothetical protein